jgi:antitoxin ChpS
VDKPLLELVTARMYIGYLIKSGGHETIYKKSGNSAEIRLSAAMLTQIGAAIGDAVEVDPQAFRVANPRYKLDDLLTQCNKNAPAPADMASWESMSSVGSEIL